jgi:hypothetical protein
VALDELADALASVQNVFTEYHHEAAFLRFAQALTSANLALAPLVAAAAVLAVMGRTRLAICPLAALVLLDWMLQDVWSIPLHGLELSLDFGVEVILALHPSGGGDGRRGTGAQGPPAGARRPAGQHANAHQLDRSRRLRHQYHGLRLLSSLTATAARTAIASPGRTSIFINERTCKRDISSLAA